MLINGNGGQTETPHILSVFAVNERSISKKGNKMMISRKHLAAVNILTVCLLLFPGTPSRAVDRLLLVSCLEQGTRTEPCRLYTLNIESSSIAKSLEIPFENRDVEHVDAYPQYRRFVIWTKAQKGKEVESLIVNVDHLESVERISFPMCDGSLRGYLQDTVSSGPLVIAEYRSAQSEKSKLHSASLNRDAKSKEEPSFIEAADFVMPGVAGPRGHTSFSIPLEYKKDERRFVQNGTSHIKVDLSVDARTVATVAQQPVRSSPMLVCADQKAIVVRWNVPLEENLGVRFYVFKKNTDSWRLFTAKKDNSRLQMFPEWLAIQEEYARGSTSRKTGEFAFYNRDENTSFTWQATSDDTLAQEAEVLAVWEKNFVYRLDTKLYEAEIVNGTVTNQRLIFDGANMREDQINPIRYVHWVFRLPK
jgi:hypothetical protein